MKAYTIMRKTRAILLASLFSLLGVNAWGQTEVIASFTGQELQTTASETQWYAANGTNWGGSYYKMPTTSTITSPVIDFSQWSDVTVTVNIRTYGGAITNGTFLHIFLGEEDLGTVQPTSSTLTDKTASITPTSKGALVFKGTNFTSAKYAGVKSISISGIKKAVTDCAAPTFSPEGGEFSTADYKVTLSTTTEGASIYYTTDGTTEPSASSTLYTDAGITLNATTTIKAIAIKQGLDNSEVVTATYTKVKPTPDLTFGAESYTVNFGETVSAAATTTSGQQITYSIAENGTGSTIDTATGLVTAGTTEGTAVVTATIAETDDYKGVSKTVNVIVKDPNKVEFTDELTLETLTFTASYGDCPDYTSQTSGITYAAYGYKGSSGSNTFMQYRTSDSKEGIIVKTNPNGLKLKQVTIEWDNNTTKTFDLYAKQSSYTATSELYNTNTQGNKIATLSSNTTSVYTAENPSETFIGFRSTSGAIYIEKITLVWEGQPGSVVIAAPTVLPAGGTFTESQDVTMTATEGNKIVYTIDGSDPTISNTAVTVDNNTVNIKIEKPADNQTVTLNAAATDGKENFSTVVTYDYHFVTISGEGTETSPYTVEDITNLKALGTPISGSIYLKGTIIGAVKSGPSIDNTVKTNIALGTTTEATEGYVAVGIGDNQLRAIANVADNPDVIGKEIVAQGAYDSNYFKVGGISEAKAISGLHSFTVTNSEGFATYYDDCAYNMPEGLNGNIITAAEGGRITLGTEYAAGELVPAKTPLLLKAAAGNYPVVNTSSTTSAPGGNLLYGSNGVNTNGIMDVAPATAGNTMKYYILSHGKAGTEYAGTLGFFFAAANGEAVAYKAPYAFLAVEVENGMAAPMMFDIFNPTGLCNTLTVEKSEAKEIYTLSGLRVNGTLDTLPAGIYIVNGKKMIVK